jgi:hypothetical protein
VPLTKTTRKQKPVRKTRNKHYSINVESPMKVKEISLSNRMIGETINKAQYMADIDLRLGGMILPHSKHFESQLQRPTG